MPQLHFYVADAVAAELRKKAAGKGLTISKYLADMARNEVLSDWPEGFFEEVIGGWQGSPLTRPEQGEFEEREPFGVSS